MDAGINVRQIDVRHSNVRHSNVRQIDVRHVKCSTRQMFDTSNVRHYQMFDKKFDFLIVILILFLLFL